MGELILLGDSIIDNGAYVAPGEPDVAGQIRAALPGRRVVMRALDGSRAPDVAAALDREGLSASAEVVLSAGGNDALQRIGLLDPATSMSFLEAMELLWAVREEFRAAYAPLLDRLCGHRVLVATIYDPAFTGPEAVLQRAGEGALSAFNDVIQSAALARGFDVLELRLLFTSPEHYANSIEPSAAGGAAIAAAVAAWARK